MTDAIEAGARAMERHDMRDYEWTDEQFDTWWTKDPRAESDRERQRERAQACIDAAIASGELVHASAVAEMREEQIIERERIRCADLCRRWIDTFKDRDIKYTSPVDYAVDAINDIIDLITDGQELPTRPLDKAIASAVAAERERCAKVADRAAERDAAWAEKYPDEARRCEERELRAATIAAAIRALEPASGEYVLGWRTIDSAPKDGTPVLLGWPTFHPLVGHCEDDLWGELDSDFGFEPFENAPTHWQPLPKPPPLNTATSNGSGK